MCKSSFWSWDNKQTLPEDMLFVIDFMFNGKSLLFAIVAEAFFNFWNSDVSKKEGKDNNSGSS